jgi:hypothetical protein
VSFDLEIRLHANKGLAGCVECEPGIKHRILLGPGENRVFRTANVYRENEERLCQLLEDFDAEWAASDDYWSELLEDAYTPGPGHLLSGGVPEFHTSDNDAQRFYNFGIVTALLLMKNDLDNQSGANLYVAAMPDAEYGTFMYPWDGSYSSEVLAMLDPTGLRAMIGYWARNDIHSLLAVAYEEPEKAFLPGRFYAANGSSFFLAVWNYVNYTGDYDFLDERFGGRTILEVCRTAADWHKTRPQWNGVAHYGDEQHLFDDGTVVNYKHYVAAPVAADVWMNRALADIYESRYGDATTAELLRREAGRIAEALITNLFNCASGFEGTWKQRHEDGTLYHERHSWDFMMAGSCMSQDLSNKQKQAMRDWFVGNLVRFGSDDVWVVSQDPRDGNNGEHQMEHNGRGAYPAWPYHDGWALHAMGYQKDVVALLDLIDGVTAIGAIGQGYSPAGRRCRSNWANISGTSAAAYALHNIFDVWPGLGEFRPRPSLDGFDPHAYFENVPVRNKLYRVTAEGAFDSGRAIPEQETPVGRADVNCID